MNDSPTNGHGANGSESPNLDKQVAVYIDELNRGGELDPLRVLAENPGRGQEILEALESFIDLGSEPPADDLPLGILGDYTLRRQIGRGGMGVVYDAWQNSMDRHVALKVLPRGIAADNKAFIRFMREAKTAGQLAHPNVVSVHAMGVDDHTPYYAMEYVEGDTLGQILERMRRAEGNKEETEDRTLFEADTEDIAYYSNFARLFADVADGLQHAHSKGVIHRDIKPSNLILDAEADQGGRAKGRLRILDFGLAHLEGQESLTVSGDVVGTPVYMSPEQAGAKTMAVDHRSDVYSLGATMYEALTLKPPFKGKDYRDTLSRVIEREAAPPRAVQPKIPADLETIVLKRLRKDPGHRYGTAEALAQDLRRFLRGDPIEARPESTWEQIRRRARRRRVELAALALVLVCCLVAFLVSFFLVKSERDHARRERDAANRFAYVASLRAAQEDWKRGDLGRLAETLERQISRSGQPDLRGWEWYYLASQGRSLRFTYRAHSRVSAVKWSPDGKLLASAGAKPGQVRIWIPTSGEELRILEFERPVRSIAWSPDGSRIAAAGFDSPVRVWNWRSGVEILSVDHGWKAAVTWHPTGELLATWSPRSVRIWNLEGERIAELEACSLAAWTPDGTWLATREQRGERGDSAETTHVTIWDASSWERLESLPVESVELLAWSADGVWLASAGKDRQLRFFNTKSRQWSLRELGPILVNSLDWSIRGELALGTTSGAVEVWDGVTGRVKARFLGHHGRVKAVSWSPGGQFLASGSFDGTVKLWAPHANEERSTLEGGTFVSWSADGRFLATEGTDSAVRVYDAASFEPLLALEKEFLSCEGLAFSPDSALLAASRRDGSVKIWSVPSGEVYWTFAAHLPRVFPVAWSPDSGYLATGGTDSAVRVWDVRARGLIQTLEGHSGGTVAMAFSPDGKRFASLSMEETLSVWEVPAWEKSLERRLDSTRTGARSHGQPGLSFSPAGDALLAGLPDGTILVIDPKTGRDRMRLEGHAAAVASVTWSPDGKRIASGGLDGAVKIWHGETGEELLSLHEQRGQVRSVALSPDGLRLAVADTSTLRILDASRGYRRGAGEE